MLQLAIQKGGRLQEDSLKLLKKCGLDFEIPSYYQLRIKIKNFPVEIFLLRNLDIPRYIHDNIMDGGFLGENTVLESFLNLKCFKKLNFGKCKLSLAVPNYVQFENLNFFNDKTIATSYPKTLKSFLNKKKLNSKIHEINGSVELSTTLGLADSICDLISTGETLANNGLKEVYKIFDSEVCLFTNNNVSNEKNKIFKELIFRIDSVLHAEKNRYILMNVPNDKLKNILKILPGINSPSILPLSKKGWSSVHTVVKKDSFWNIINELKAKGAEGILVLPLDNMIL